MVEWKTLKIIRSGLIQSIVKPILTDKFKNKNRRYVWVRMVEAEEMLAEKDKEIAALREMYIEAQTSLLQLDRPLEIAKKQAKEQIENISRQGW